MADYPHATLKPPPGRPSWMGSGDLPLIYLGWGKRDFARHPVSKHYDLGTSYYLVVQGDLLLSTLKEDRCLTAPAVCMIDEQCLFGIHHGRAKAVEVLVWVWRDGPQLDALKPPRKGFREFSIRAECVPLIAKLHQRCRDEVAGTDTSTSLALSALRSLVEVELLRASQSPQVRDDFRWELARSWICANLSIHTPIPALCDYLRMSPSTLHRFFMKQAGVAPGTYFRQAKRQEASRLINQEGWQVKAAAFHLGYRHPGDLSRILTK